MHLFFIVSDMLSGEIRFRDFPKNLNFPKNFSDVIRMEAESFFYYTCKILTGSFVF